VLDLRFTDAAVVQLAALPDSYRPNVRCPHRKGQIVMSKNQSDSRVPGSPCLRQVTLSVLEALQLISSFSRLDVDACPASLGKGAIVPGIQRA